MSGDAEDDNYTNSNRAFLQALISRSTLTFQEAKPILAAIYTAQEGREILAEDVTEADLRRFVAAANHALAPLDLEIRDTAHQRSGTRTYALVNAADDGVTQLATAFSPDEMGFVKRVLDAMFDTNNTARHEVMAVPAMQAVNLHNRTAQGRRTSGGGGTQENGGAGAGETQGSGAQGITIAQAEKVLQGLVEQGWFEKSKKGFYTLAPRALMELRQWLIETYNDPDDSDGEDEHARPPRIKLCQACKEIVTVGQRCPRRACQCRLHDICAPNFFRVQKAKKCPLCKVDWTGEDMVGEKAAPTGPSRRKSGGARTERASQAVASPAAAPSRQANGNDDGEDDDE